MLHDYYIFKYKSNSKIALVTHKDNLNSHIKFLSKKLKSLDWISVDKESLIDYLNEKELKKYDIEL